ncbi:MAG: hypothetical protein ABSG94_07410, partial [Brevinematales bacterium]
KGDSSERFLLESALFKMMDYKNIIPAGELRSELIALLNTGTPRTIQGQEPAKSGETDEKKALINILSASPVLKSMISSISRIDSAQGNITAFVNDMHCFEYLERNRKEIEQELFKSTGREILLVFKINSSGERGAVASGADEEVKVKKPKAGEQGHDNTQIVNDIVNLFDGKVSK